MKEMFAKHREELIEKLLGGPATHKVMARAVAAEVEKPLMNWALAEAAQGTDMSEVILAVLNVAISTLVFIQTEHYAKEADTIFLEMYKSVLDDTFLSLCEEARSRRKELNSAMKTKAEQDLKNFMRELEQILKG